MPRSGSSPASWRMWKRALCPDRVPLNRLFSSLTRVRSCVVGLRFCPLRIQVWSLEQPEWHCRIDEGSAGLVASCWSPDGRHILNTTEFHVSAKAPGTRRRAEEGDSSRLSPEIAG